MSVITEASMKANGQIAVETGNVLHSFSENTDEITGINERTQDINNKLIALEKMNGEVADLARQVNEITKENQERMDTATDSMEQSVKLTKAGMESICEAGNSTALITSSNSRMSEQIIEMDKTVENIRIQSSEVAKGMEQVNTTTKSNYSAIEHVTAATQENNAGVEEIESMVERIKELAESAL